jgi:pimeloyl-ACP methyl ester carboxylesterase
MGIDIVGMSMRGHGKCELRYDWTLLKVIADIEALLDAVVTRYENPPKQVWIYGHSAGGFIGLRLASHPSGWWAENLKGIILESPATSFPLIIESITPPFLRPIRSWIRQILRREFERIHPDLGIRYANSAVPHFGMPEVPMLVLQANTDSRLGLKHYELLMKHVDPELSTVHLLKELEHTSTKDNITRRTNLEKWLEPQLINNEEALT